MCTYNLKVLEAPLLGGYLLGAALGQHLHIVKDHRPAAAGGGENVGLWQHKAGVSSKN